MAQPETSDPPSMSATTNPSPSLSHTMISLATEPTTSFSESNPAQTPPVPPPTNDAAGGSDDEVQFIFSAPRRRKKKRRRVKSSLISTEDFQALEHTANLTRTETLSQLPRRGTTGMVHRLKFCHSRDIEGNTGSGVVRSGSLPSVTQTGIIDANRRPAPFNQSNANKPLFGFFPFAPFMAMPGWNEPGIQLQNIPVVENSWTFMQPEDGLSSKRKRDGEVEQPIQHPSQRAEKGPSIEPSMSSQIDEIQLGSFDMFRNSDSSSMTANAKKVQSPTLTMKSFCWKQIPKTDQNVRCSPTPITTKSSASDTLGPNTRDSPQSSTPTPESTPNANGMQQTQTVTVPARLVPEQSVSPRTQTVEIPRPSFLNQSEARQTTLFRRAMNSPSRRNVQSSRNPGAMLSMNRNNQFQTLRSVPPQPFHFQKLPWPQQPQRLASPLNSPISTCDVLRKPSLYKVPPWPSNPSPIGPAHRSSSLLQLPISNSNAESLNMGSTSGSSGFRDSQRMNMAHTPGYGRGPLPIHGMLPMIPPRRPPLQSPARPSPPTSPHPQLNPNKRKHSPNLIVDIAETCQENFPFAAVAERHQSSIQKVFDTFSAVVQLPLLRSAADNRRHGPLAKRRVKEFKDAKKAMEIAMNQNDAHGVEAGGKGRRQGSGRKGREQPLLRAAILNHASRGKQGGS